MASDQIVPAFESLSELKHLLVEIRQSHASTMQHYFARDGKGFYHQAKKPDTASRASTATCVSSLVRAGLWTENTGPINGHGMGIRDTTAAVAGHLIAKPWKSAELAENNPFTLAFVAHGILDLAEAVEDYSGVTGHLEILDGQVLPLLIEHLDSGATSIHPYPKSAYLTYNAFRAIKRRKVVELDEVARKANEWARGEINKQLALLNAGSRSADPMQMAYAIILAAESQGGDDVAPESKTILGYAIQRFFESQNDRGVWPLSQPLFHYPDVGNAYCFEYELLGQLVACQPLQTELLKHLPRLRASAEILGQTSFDLNPAQPGMIVGWASGHHPQIPGPESWSTASVYEFVTALDRLVAEAIRRSVFDELGATYTSPRSAPLGLAIDHFAPPQDFLDTPVKIKGETASLRETMFDRFVKPIATDAPRVASGQSLSKDTPMSAIFFGAPGTSKTEMAASISKFVGWPLLPVDPSYLVSEGLDRIQAMANRLFNMLSECEEVVVLLDEFDEMGRDRANNKELLSRFITTAMLPKLIKINEERRIVFLLATNYVAGFDAAFSRRGRFDVVLQMMPPTTDEKFRKWPELERALEGTSPEESERLRGEIAELTFAEAKELAKRVGTGKQPGDIRKALKTAHENCTLQQPHDPLPPGDVTNTETSRSRLWVEACADEERYNRVG